MSNVLPLADGPRRRGTATSAFGVSRREGHDASAFYARFATPEVSTEDTLTAHLRRDEVWLGDARDMDAVGEIADGSVALVVTSPPYFAGKEYEEALGQGHIPASYGEYLGMLHAVFARCRDKLEPGGRIAVNVANLGRKPYRSLSADVVAILEDLGFLLRGEIIWRKQAAAGGSCAWGSYQRPGNPVLRDITERVVVASKGRFDRALGPRERRAGGWPHEGTITMDDFVDATLDLWEIPAERATRVGHPAPFPVELPQRLIELHTYRGDLVLDPFMGSGSTAVAALRSERYFVGFDTDADYVGRARTRVAEERVLLAGDSGRRRVTVPAVSSRLDRDGEDQAGAVGRGRRAQDVALGGLEASGFRQIETGVVVRDLGLEVTFRALDATGKVWLFELSGAFSTSRPGLRRAETLWRALGKAAVAEAGRRAGPGRKDLGPLVLLSTDLPGRNTPGARALEAASSPGGAVFDVVEILDPGGLERLRSYGEGGHRAR